MQSPGLACEAKRWDARRAAWVPCLPRLGRVFGVRAPRQSGELASLCLLGRTDRLFLGRPLPLTVFFRRRHYPVARRPEYGPCLLVAAQVVLPGTGRGPWWSFAAPRPRDPARVGLPLFLQWALPCRQSLTMPGRPPLLREEGIRWSAGGRLVIGL